MMEACIRAAWLAAALLWGCGHGAEVVDPAEYELETSGADRRAEAPADAAPDAETDAVTVTKAAPDTEADTVTDADTDTVTVTDTVTDAVTVTDADTDKDAVTDADAVAEATTSVAGSITIELRGFKHARGQVLVALWRTDRGFPEKASRAFGKKRTSVHGGRASVLFEDVPPGPFAVVAHHDEDRDFVMDTGLMGIPAEGYGFSRNATGNFGPPSFEDARIWLRTREDKRVRIRMRY